MRLDNQTPTLFGQTPWQTTGPFFHFALPWRGGADLVGGLDIGARDDLVPAGHYGMNMPTDKGTVAGEVIDITGHVFDGLGQPVPDALIEIWQADAEGRYVTGARRVGNQASFTGFGRAATAEDGGFRFRTIRPGVVADGKQRFAPHIAVGVQGRGLIKRLVTRLYFADAPENADDPVLSLVPPDRRGTLVAARQGEHWRFDIVLQGAGETVFFDI